MHDAGSAVQPCDKTTRPALSVSHFKNPDVELGLFKYGVTVCFRGSSPITVDTVNALVRREVWTNDWLREDLVVYFSLSRLTQAAQ